VNAGARAQRGAGAGALPRITLRKRLQRAIRGGHPWIYRDAIAGAPRLADGAAVMVAAGDGRPLARGFWDARSPIAVRIVCDAAGDPQAAVAGRVAAALERRRAIFAPGATDAFRWIHGEADELPGVHVDMYARAASVRFDGGGARAFYRALPAALRAAAERAGMPLRAIVERRPRGEAGAERVGALVGAVPDGEIEIIENGLRFGVDLAHGQKGGLFLDQRDNRALVGALAGGRSVLNLFGYTGGFSIYAAAGGARATVTVDVAAPAIAAARRNFARNGLAQDGARFVAGDAFAFLEQAAAAGERFELVISDPPSFAASRRALPAGLRAYRRLHRLCAQVTAPGGTLCAASCSSHVDRDAFLATVRDGARDAGRRFALRELRGAAADHPVVANFPEGDYLKFAVGVL
jgi:23S rRNA (cytosine1962-C5)-methyltransferase